MKPLPRAVAAIALAAALTTAGALSAAGPVHAGSSGSAASHLNRSATLAGTATATFAAASEWSGGYVGRLTVHNGGGAPITGWRVEFDLPAGTQVTTHWSAVLTRTGDHYAFADAAWNGTLAPGASASFGWVAAGNGHPTGCTLNGDPCDGVPTDFAAPTAPADARIVLNPGVTLVWEPSTDDQGVVAYEVYESNQLLATVTATSYVYTTTNAIPPRLYLFAVRAVDAAGNASPSAYVPLGGVWNDVPPAAPTGVRVSAGPQVLTVAWEPVPARLFIDTPISGYEVYVNGELAGRVGDPKLAMPTPAAGTYVIGVRAFNAKDLFSPLTEVSYAVG
jgi:chitinase